MDKMEIMLRTLTPLWTGGVDRTSDRLHETGLIGSLRWWYEALVRGLGGYACDPTDEKHKCKEYDPKIGKKSICPACYLFGTTGWARLFRLQLVEEEIRNDPLHFYTTLSLNKGWLRRVFRFGNTTVPFGVLQLEIIGRGQEDEYAISQLSWAIQFAAQYGGLGAKLQHGFGQVALTDNPDNGQAEQTLRKYMPEFREGRNNGLWPTCQRFFSISIPIPDKHPLIKAILAGNPIGSVPSSLAYIPCAFDFRYRGGVVRGRQLGFRKWLIDREWSAKDISSLLGETKAKRDEERAGSRVFFGMPWRNSDGDYILKVFGFVPHNIELQKVKENINEYMTHLLNEEGGCRWTI